MTPETKRPRLASACSGSVLEAVSNRCDALFSPPDEVRDWANLSPEPVRKIGDYLLVDDPAEYIRMREPLRGDGKLERFVNVRTGATLKIRLPDAHQYYHHGNAERLLVLEHVIADAVCLLNPLTLAFTELPGLTAVHKLSPFIVPAHRSGMFSYHKDIVKAAGIVVDVNNQVLELRRPVVVLSLTVGYFTALICAEPGDSVWRAVDISCAGDATGRPSVIQGGLAVQGHFYIPTRTGDVLTVAIEPSPHLSFVAKMPNDLVGNSVNENSFLVPSLDDMDCGMLIVRTRRPNGRLGTNKFEVDLLNGKISIQKPSRVIVFLPSVTLRSSMFSSVVRNKVYINSMKKLMQGSYI